MWEVISDRNFWYRLYTILKEKKKPKQHSTFLDTTEIINLFMYQILEGIAKIIKKEEF